MFRPSDATLIYIYKTINPNRLSIGRERINKYEKAISTLPRSGIIHCHIMQ